ncbi:tryptophan synthase subunit alpha [Agaribacterium haliotis]|uniref:tryptophan synthase subunit alpha n=1 Tax=Agaribacterium haliotis TaxID=2013869 RepID=UPI000BB579B7|nr:tryptophan synthase subunit alpha [Agaribacterium haliotis]
MNRINQVLSELKSQGRKALVTYIVCGDPRPEQTVQSMHALVEGGADIIELGVPFSDPMAEGPVIQKAHERALEHGTSLKDAMACVKQFREQDARTPVVLMGYANPVERFGYSAFAQAAKAAGVDALLTVDLPPEEALALDQELKANELENIFLIAPTTAPARTKEICELASGFVYYVSFRGVTGASQLDADEVAEKVSQIREVAHTPVLVGFGIKDASSAKAVGACSDGVVVGSALVNIMAQADASAEQINTQLKALVQSLRTALDEL